MSTKYVITRAKLGCCINGREFVLDNHHKVRKFPSRNAAKAFLLKVGKYTERELTEELDSGFLSIDPEKDML
jgi:hypothetical protein